MTHHWIWIDEPETLVFHEEQLAEHGGGAGIRDISLLQSALSRPRNLAAYDNPDPAALAASYAFGIARNHPFVDGNKRSEEHTSELQSLMRISYAVFCLKKKKANKLTHT